VRYVGFIVLWNCATEKSPSPDASEAVSVVSPRRKSMNLGGSGISWPVPLSLMNAVMSFPTSQSSNDKRIFSQAASSLTQTVEEMLAKLHRLLFVKSIRSSSRSWNFCHAVSPRPRAHSSVTYVTGGLPVSIPPSSRLFQGLHSSLIFRARG